MSARPTQATTVNFFDLCHNLLQKNLAVGRLRVSTFDRRCCLRDPKVADTLEVLQNVRHQSCLQAHHPNRYQHTDTMPLSSGLMGQRMHQAGLSHQQEARPCAAGRPQAPRRRVEISSFYRRYSTLTSRPAQVRSPACCGVGESTHRNRTSQPVPRLTLCAGVFFCSRFLRRRCCCCCLSQGFEIGSGLSGARMTGSEHNDPFYMQDGAVRTRSNRCGAGHSFGMGPIRSNKGGGGSYHTLQLSWRRLLPSNLGRRGQRQSRGGQPFDVDAQKGSIVNEPPERAVSSSNRRQGWARVGHRFAQQCCCRRRCCCCLCPPACTLRSGGIQGGISNGEDIVLRVAFKPTSTIGIKQQTVTRAGERGWGEALG